MPRLPLGFGWPEAAARMARDDARRPKSDIASMGTVLPRTDLAASPLQRGRPVIQGFGHRPGAMMPGERGSIDILDVKR